MVALPQIVITLTIFFFNPIPVMTEGAILDLGWANFFCKEPHSEYFQLCVPFG